MSACGVEDWACCGATSVAGCCTLLLASAEAGACGETGSTGVTTACCCGCKAGVLSACMRALAAPMSDLLDAEWAGLLTEAERTGVGLDIGLVSVAGAACGAGVLAAWLLSGAGIGAGAAAGAGADGDGRLLAATICLG